jgi:hypothetical protein
MPRQITAVCLTLTQVVIVQIDAGQPCAGRSIGDRLTDTEKADGAEPSRRTTFQCSRSSMYRAPRFERGGCGRNSCREHHFSFPHVAQLEEAPALEAGQCGCKSCHGDFHFAPVAQLAEAAGLNPVQCWCKSDREYLWQILLQGITQGSFNR